MGTDAHDVTPTVSTIWANIEGEGISEDEFYQMAPRLAQTLLSGGSLEEFPLYVREGAYHVLSHCPRQIESSLLEKYKDELADEDKAESYDAFISQVTEEFKKLIELLDV